MLEYSRFGCLEAWILGADWSDCLMGGIGGIGGIGRFGCPGAWILGLDWSDCLMGGIGGFRRFRLIFIDFHRLSAIFIDFHGFQRLNLRGLWQPVASCGILWRAVAAESSPLRKEFAPRNHRILEAWRLACSHARILEVWMLRGLDSWSGLE